MFLHYLGNAETQKLHLFYHQTARRNIQHTCWHFSDEQHLQWVISKLNIFNGLVTFCIAWVWLKDDGPMGQTTDQWSNPSSAASSGPSFKIWLKETGRTTVQWGLWNLFGIANTLVITSYSQLLFRFSGMDERTDRRLCYGAMVALLYKII